jgi:hypothetical protein
LLFLASAFAHDTLAQNKEGGKQSQPVLLEDNSTPQVESDRNSSQGKEQVLFHAKTLIEKEKQFHALRNRLVAVNGDALVDDAIRSMYVPYKTEPIAVCDFTFTDDFDKTTIPADLSNCHSYLLEYFSQNELNELSFCLNYLGIQAVDQEVYLFYVLPYKNHIRYLKQIQLSDRDLAWFVAIDLRQTVCQKQATLEIKDQLLKPNKSITN